jgi:hypothetical protein
MNFEDKLSLGSSGATRGGSNPPSRTTKKILRNSNLFRQNMPLARIIHESRLAQMQGAGCAIVIFHE